MKTAGGLVASGRYGTGELGMHSGECSHRNHLHYGATGVVLTELIDPVTSLCTKKEAVQCTASRLERCNF